MYNLQNSAFILAKPHAFMDEGTATLDCMHWRFFTVHDLLKVRVCAACGYVYAPDYLPINHLIAAWAIGGGLE